MRKLFIILFGIISNICFGQGNGNVELADFTNWKCYSGMNTGGTLNLSAFSLGIVPGRHTIMIPGIDPVVGSPYLNRTFPYQVYGNAPNPVFHDSFSIRLGNTASGSQAEIVSYHINALNALDGFSIAMVLQNGHPGALADNPFINYWVSTSDILSTSMNAGNLLGFQHIPASGSSFFSPAASGIVYREWTRINLLDAFPSLIANVGAPVTIYFATADCSASGHFGYAYIDNVFSKSWTVSSFAAPTIFVASSGPITVDGRASVAESKYRWQIVKCNVSGVPIPGEPTYTTAYYSGFVVPVNLHPIFSTIVPASYFVAGTYYRITLLTENDGSGSLSLSNRVLLATP